MARVHLHIGSHKTGTTSLQHWLSANAAALEGQGLFVPTAGRRGNNPAHSQLAHRMVAEPATPLERIDVWADLAAQIAGRSDDIVVSSEVFSERTRSADQARRITQFFAAQGHDTHVVLYLRDYPAFLNSIYVQRVKRFKFGGSFREFLARVRAEQGLRYTHMLAPFRDLAPITLRPFPPPAGGLEADFLTAIGRADLDTSALAAPRHDNPRVSALAILAARLIRARWDERAEGLTRDETEGVFKRLCRDNTLTGPGFQGCDAALATWINATWARELRAVAKVHWGAEWAEVLPPARPVPNALDPARVHDLDPETRDRVRAVVEGTLAAKSPGRRSLFSRMRRG